MPTSAKLLHLLTPQGLNPTHPLFIFLPGMDGTGELLQPQLMGLGSAFDLRCLSIPSDDLTDWDGLVEQSAHLIEIEQKRFSPLTVEELPLKRLEQPTLILASGADRLLRSVTEAERLVRYLPHAQKILLPQSGHACLLETDVKLVDILRFFPSSLTKLKPGLPRRTKPLSLSQ